MAETPQPSTASTTRRKVRVIAKIREPSNQISISKSHNSSSISFLDHSGNSGKHTYKLDHCYEPNDDNFAIFTAEIKPLVCSAFSGSCATVFAFGDNESGKSCTIQGTDSSPGLAVLAMEEFLVESERGGMSVAVSCYEVFNDQVYDVLGKSGSVVSVLENAQGKIQLKGLSQTFVKSLTDFKKLYTNDKRNSKMMPQPSRRSHKGLMIHLFDSDENGNDGKLVGRMIFVDLAGFGDPRKNSTNTYTIVENSRVHKSLYAIQSVVYALNCSDNRVPYRDSKLTYMLRDSLSGKNKILMIACLSPTVCQDTIYMVNLASRCSKGNHRVCTDSLRRVKSAHMIKSSSKDVENSKMASSISRNGKYSTLKKKKLNSSRLPLSENRINIAGVAAPILGSNKVVDEVTQGSSVEKASDPVDIVSDTQQSLEMGASLDIVPETPQIPQECVSCLLENDETARPAIPETENTLEVADSTMLQASPNEMGDGNAYVDFESSTEKQMSSGHRGASPPLSARIQELSNYLKSLHSITPMHTNMLQEFDTAVIEPKTQSACNSMITMDVSTDEWMTSNIDGAVTVTVTEEPKTPVARIEYPTNHKWDDVVLSSPWTTLKVRSVGVKNCLNQECVRFINSASKEELKGLRGIGDKRATYIMQLRERSPEHFKNIDDLKEVGLSAKQIKTMVKNIAGDIFG